eukprot:3430054-Rhodomonas_salina.3
MPCTPTAVLNRADNVPGKPLGGSAHFEAFAVTFDASMAAGSGRTGSLTRDPPMSAVLRAVRR